MARYEVLKDGSLNEAARKLLDKRNYAVLATRRVDGGVHQSVVWVVRDGNSLLFSTVEGRVKHRNVLRDPRADAIVYDRDDPEEYVEVSGRVEVLPDDKKEFSNSISRKYTGEGHIEQDPSNVRVILRLIPVRSAYRVL